MAIRDGLEKREKEFAGATNMRIDKMNEMSPLQVAGSNRRPVAALDSRRMQPEQLVTRESQLQNEKVTSSFKISSGTCGTKTVGSLIGEYHERFEYQYVHASWMVPDHRVRCGNFDVS